MCGIHIGMAGEHGEKTLFYDFNCEGLRATVFPDTKTCNKSRKTHLSAESFIV